MILHVIKYDGTIQISSQKVDVSNYVVDVIWQQMKVLFHLIMSYQSTIPLSITANTLANQRVMLLFAKTQ